MIGLLTVFQKHILEKKMKMIEVEDYDGNEALIDPLSIQFVLQGEKEGIKVTRVFFNNGCHVNLIENYEEVKNKINKAMNYF